MVENRNVVVFLFVLSWVLIFGFGFKSDHDKPMSKHQAYKFVRNTAAVESFLNMRGGVYKECISSEVLRPCDTEWVTCIDEAWVVKFEMDQKCVEHDGRLAVTVLVDAHNRVVKSSYPEKDYFENMTYCMEDYECLTDEDKSLNFIYGLIDGYREGGSKCRNNRCEVK